MPVALLPPITSSGCWPGWDGVTMPVYEAPRYVRGRNMGRWHRPRSGTRRPGRATVSFWCGAGYVDLDVAMAADSVPEAEPVCGTCEGRALGAGQDDTPAGLPRLAFEPRWLSPPAVCPGSGRNSVYRGLVEDLRRNVCRCLVCGVYVPLRASGGPYNPSYGPARHEPGDDLFSPCPWHAWNYPARRPDGTVGCSCGWREAN